MLTEAYIEALLVDEELADQVWDAWNSLRARNGPNPPIGRCTYLNLFSNGRLLTALFGAGGYRRKQTYSAS
jgi:hypothetical protein